MQPYDPNWLGAEHDPWIVEHADHIQHIFCRVWQEVYNVLGPQYTETLDIQGFARYMSSNRKGV